MTAPKLLPMGDYSTKKISQKLMAEVKNSLEDLDYGSIEIYVVNNQVTQISKRRIKKTSQKKPLDKK